jgi:hypothetical protein
VGIALPAQRAGIYERRMARDGFGKSLPAIAPCAIL